MRLCIKYINHEIAFQSGNLEYRDKFYGKLAFESRMAALKMYEYGEEIEKVSKGFHCKTHRHMFLKQWGYITSMKFFFKFKIYCWIRYFSDALTYMS